MAKSATDFSSTWIWVDRYTTHSKSQRKNPILVRTSDVLYFKETENKIVAYFCPAAFGTDKDSPLYGFLDKQSAAQIMQNFAKEPRPPAEKKPKKKEGQEPKQKKRKRKEKKVEDQEEDQEESD